MKQQREAPHAALYVEDSREEQDMELEHVFRQTTYFTVFQMAFMTTLYVMERTGRGEIIRSFVRSVTSAVVSFGPFGLLVYILREVSRLS